MLHDAADILTLNRPQLYELIWKDPTRTVAQRLGISDVGLAKICRKLHIPRPWRGYWREKETGQRPRQPKLPPWPTHAGKEPERITFRPAHSEDKGACRPPEPETLQRQREYETTPDHQIHVAEILTEPDRVVRRAARLLKRSGERGLLLAKEHPCLDIQVSKDSLDRALRVFDAIVKAVHARGWPVSIQSEHPFLTQITVLDEVVAVSITEKIRQVELPPEPNKNNAYLFLRKRYTYESTGLLTLRLTENSSSWNSRAWKDGKRRRIESCLNGVMVGFVELAERRKTARREEERRRAEWAEAERRRVLAFERAEREKNRREELQREIQAWSRAEEVRAYVAQLQSAAQDHILREPNGRLARWLRWAQSYAVSIDPLAELEALPRDPQGYGTKALDLESFGLHEQAREETRPETR